MILKDKYFSAESLAQDLGVTRTTLYRWNKIFAMQRSSSLSYILLSARGCHPITRKEIISWFDALIQKKNTSRISAIYLKFHLLG